jgi:alpha-glucosidase
MYLRVVTAVIVLFCFAGHLSAAEEPFVLASPDGAVRFRLSLDGDARLQYAVTFSNRPVIATSPIGTTVDGVNLANGVDLGKTDPYKVNETYPWNGVHSTAVDSCNGARIAITHRPSHTAYTLDIRAYNDGIAFRHVVPGEGARVPDEATVFQLPSGSTLWYTDMEAGYEGVYLERPIRDVLPGGYMAPPVTFRLPQGAGYASITEGGLRHYSGMGLQADDSGGLHARLAHAMELGWVWRWQHARDTDRIRKPAVITGTIITPWRIVMIGADLNTLVNCDIVHNVADPPDPKLFPNGINTDWIKPGRSMWSYLDGGNNTVQGMKQWAELGHQLGFEYNLLENWWSGFPEADLKDLVDYSRERGVRLVVWRSRNAFTNDRDPEKAIRSLFETCRRAGIAGVKIDFFDSEHKEIIDLYEQILTLAAEYHLLVDFHGATKPTGMERTFPNCVGVEAIRGMEMSPPWAAHDTTLPFTRMLAGLADFTPTHFGPAKYADTTWAHQIGNAVLLQAPFLVYGAHPANILANPAVDMIRSIPSVWDETVVLPVSEIGRVAAFARRRGNTWFLAVNNGPVPRTVRADLSFLEPRRPAGAQAPGRGMMGRGGVSYIATLVRDGVEADSYKFEQMTVRPSDSIYISLRSGGGFVGRFVR